MEKIYRKYEPIDFQIAKVRNYEEPYSQPVKGSALGDCLISYDDDDEMIAGLEQCFELSGEHAEGIWRLIDSYEDEYEDEDEPDPLSDCEDLHLNEAQSRGAKAFFMALMHFLRNDKAQCLYNVRKLYSKPHLAE